MSLGDYLRSPVVFNRRVADVIDAIRETWGGTSTNSSNAYTLALSVPINRVIDGELFRFIPNASNTGAATLTINDSFGNAGIASKSIKRSDGTTALASGDLVSGVPVSVQYDLANDVYRLIAVAPVGNPVMNSGTYTPTLSNTTNVGASTAYACQYSRVGNIVTVSGRVDITATLTATSTQLDMALPIASSVTTAEQLGGTGSATNIASLSCGIYAESGSKKARFQYVSVGVTSGAFFFSFTYQIL